MGDIRTFGLDSAVPAAFLGLVWPRLKSNFDLSFSGWKRHICNSYDTNIARWTSNNCHSFYSDRCRVEK
jgi:hypothetical protein